MNQAARRPPDRGLAALVASAAGMGLVRLATTRMRSGRRVVFRLRRSIVMRLIVYRRVVMRLIIVNRRIVVRLIVIDRRIVVRLIVHRGVVRRTAIIAERGTSLVGVGDGTADRRVGGPSAIDGGKVGPVGAGEGLMRYLR